jgi:hypothetical protein
VPNTRGRNSKWVFDTRSSGKIKILWQWRSDALRAMVYPIAAMSAINERNHSKDDSELKKLEDVAEMLLSMI